MIRCMAIDDEPLALQQITAYISKVPFLELVAQCQSALEAHQFLQNDTVDVIFCDINMPDLNGMDFIKTLTAPPLVVFTTAYAECCRLSAQTLWSARLHACCQPVEGSVRILSPFSCHY